MRRIVSILLLAAVLAPVMAQRPEVGFIRLVNLVAAGEGNLRFAVDDQELFPRGYTLGQKTGGMGFKAGSYKITAEKEGCQTADRDIKIATGETQTLIAYAEPIRNELEEIIGWEIKVARLRQKSPERGYRVTLVSFCEEKELAVTIIAEGTPEPFHEQVPHRKVHSVTAGRAQGGVRIAIGETVLAGFHTDDPGNYVVLIYTDPEGKRAAIHYYDPKFVIAG